MFFNVLHIGICQRFQSRIGLKQCRSYQIDPGIGTLGRKTNSYHQLIIFIILQRTERGRILFF